MTEIEQTYARIQDMNDLDDAISGLFGEQGGWVRDYFQGHSISSVWNTSDLSDSQQVAFQTAMDRYMGGMFKEDAKGFHGNDVLEYTKYVPYFSDSVVTREEFRELLEKYDGVDEQRFSKLQKEMGDELSAAFEAIAIGVSNGLADQNADEPTYSLKEITASAYPMHLAEAVKEMSFTVELMSSICGSSENLDIDSLHQLPFHRVRVANAR